MTEMKGQMKEKISNVVHTCTYLTTRNCARRLIQQRRWPRHRSCLVSLLAPEPSPPRLKRRQPYCLAAHVTMEDITKIKEISQI